MWQWPFLLIPVAAASGWMAARGSRLREVRQGSVLSSNYFKGLNYLLNEQPDKAIEIFVRMLEVDNETVETHLALGNLFRRRGEVDRAIRIHQNLIARSTLSPQHRTQALLELGQDYMRAGLLDRAETLFQELVEIDEHNDAALRALIDIYQQEKDWDKAIVAAQKLESDSGRSLQPQIAHYYCELADHAQQGGTLDTARQRAQQALECDANCVRARLLLGDIDVMQGHWADAIHHYQAVQMQNPDYLPEVVAPLQVCYVQLGMDSAMTRYFGEMLKNHNSITLMLAQAELLRVHEGAPAAERFITDQLRRRPSVRGLDRLIALNLVHSEAGAREHLLILQDLVAKLLEGKPVYKCSQCGFNGRSLHWQCPGCKSWSSVKPIHGVEGE